jgi:AAA family ATP:ADP antiporter
MTQGISDATLWDTALVLLLFIVVGAGALALVLFSWLNHIFKRQPELIQGSVAEKKVLTKFSMRENIRFLLSSRYMLCLVAIIVSYNIVINLVEVVWKQSVREMYPESIAYNVFMNKVTTWTGVVATLSSLFISGNSLRFFGWTTTAMITPIVLLLTSVGFFGALFLKAAAIGPALPLLGWVVFFGTLQNCCSRAAKYAIFDATKEMAFVPLSQEEQMKGKAAVDGICNRLGKSGGSVIYQFLLFFLTTVNACVPYVACCLVAVIGIWMAAVRKLGSQFTELTTKEPVETQSAATQTVSV